MSIRPKSGHWNYPEAFIVRNVRLTALKVKWYLNCMEEPTCSDSLGEVTLKPNESFEKGLGDICAKWALNIAWKNNPPDDWHKTIALHDWGGVAEYHVRVVRRYPQRLHQDPYTTTIDSDNEPNTCSHLITHHKS